MMLVEIVAALEEKGYRESEYEHFDMAFIRNVIFREKDEKGRYVDPPAPKDGDKKQDGMYQVMRRRNWPDWLIRKELSRGKK